MAPGHECPPRICEQGTHIVQKLPTGLYICVQCGQGFHEHVDLVIQVGAASQPR